MFIRHLPWPTVLRFFDAVISEGMYKPKLSVDIQARAISSLRHWHSSHSRVTASFGFPAQRTTSSTTSTGCPRTTCYFPRRLFAHVMPSS